VSGERCLNHIRIARVDNGDMPLVRTGPVDHPQIVIVKGR
jgi:hypothetical protein